MAGGPLGVEGELSSGELWRRSWEAGGRAGSSWLPSCLAAAQLAQPRCPAGPSQDDSMQGEGSAAGVCVGTSRSPAPAGRGGAGGKAPTAHYPVLLRGLRHSGLHTLMGSMARV